MLLLFGVVAFFYFMINPSEVDFLLQCPLYKTTGVYCPGCGSQRAIHHLLHLNFIKAATNNILLLLGLLSVAYHYGILFVNRYFNKNYKSIFNNTKSLLIILIIIILFWILRNIPHYPFTLLAPDN
ncbi:MAG: DUF2752 domain-containing protein [Flavobacteriaceae bacterium]|nr:DUF2752 domain-containing protein [Flavobacteriaceae bacterium]